MNQRHVTSSRALRSSRFQAILEGGLFICAAAMVVVSATAAKRGMFSPALAVVDEISTTTSISLEESFSDDVSSPLASIAATAEPMDAVTVAPVPVLEQPADVTAGSAEEVITPEAGFVRYYNGRPLRAVRTVWMTVTAYSPDHRSCGKWADGITASNKSVWTNGMKLVAADTRLLPMGTLLSVPGYDSGNVVPVLDRGGAIKGSRLDVLYPTHAIARKWGVQRLPVTIWEYADEN